MKNYLHFPVLLCFTLVLVACGGDEETGPAPVAISDSDSVAAAKSSLKIIYAGSDSAASVTQNVGLNTSSSNGTTVAWSSDTPAVIAIDGTVSLPAFGEGVSVVTLSAFITKNQASDSSVFNLTVVEAPFTNTEIVEADNSSLVIAYGSGDTFDNVTQNIGLATSGANGSTIFWISNTPAVIATDGSVKRPDFGAGNAAVTLTAIITSNSTYDTKTFNLTVVQTPPLDTESITADKTALEISYALGDTANSVTQNIGLSTSGATGTSISWSSDLPSIIATDGTVLLPANGSGNVTVTLTATLAKNTDSDTKMFVLNVLEIPPTDAEAVAFDKAALDIGYSGSDSINSVTENIVLNTSGSNGSTISWESDAPDVIGTDGTVTQPINSSDTTVTLTATINKNGTSDTKIFVLTVPQVIIDLDGDGFNSSIDCNDFNSVVNPGMADMPDDSFLDSNCDNIDGNVALSFFVSPNGSDANIGSKALPFLTIQFAIDSANADSSKKNVLIAAGTYAESLLLLDGVSLFGGYDLNFDRSNNLSSVIASTGTTALSTSYNTSVAYVDMLKIQAVNAVESGLFSSSYGIRIIGTSNLTLRNNDISAGSGADGTAGAAGNSGVGGTNGEAGSEGICGDTATVVPGGAGGTSPANYSNGGGGGKGGQGCSYGGTGGSSSTRAGGAGGSYGKVEYDWLKGCYTTSYLKYGDYGNSGYNGAAGTSGDGGIGGKLTTGWISGWWASSAGVDGINGGNGSGGSGGGGGGGICGNYAQCGVIDSTGNGGGGGGGGGTGGTLGFGGGGGGGSFALFVLDSTYITVENNVLTSANGGNGGVGGAGGSGGYRGGGGSGGYACGGSGGTGGNGGWGGNGGHGGGGAGGPSYGIYSSNSLITTNGNTISVGSGGTGGTSSGSPGADGTAAETN